MFHLLSISSSLVVSRRRSLRWEEEELADETQASSPLIKSEVALSDHVGQTRTATFCRIFVGLAFLLSLSVYIFVCRMNLHSHDTIAGVVHEHPHRKILCPPSEGADLVGYYGAVGDPDWTRARFDIRSSHSSSEIVKALYNEGVQQQFGFNSIEAQRNLEAAIAIDPKCAICYLALACTYGPTLNSKMRSSDFLNGKMYISSAVEIARSPAGSSLTSADRAMIFAQELRFSATNESEWLETGQSYYDTLYSDAMLKLTEEYPTDIDASAMWADSVMLLDPWRYYENISGEKKLRQALAPVFEKLQHLVLTTHHLLAFHLWIHITEQSSQPQVGEPAADLLRELVRANATSHLVHMPSHTYFRVGRYDECIESGRQALAIDAEYSMKCLSPYLHSHNIALVIAASIAKQDVTSALDLSVQAAELSPYAAVYLPGIFPLPKELVLARFGKWNDILDTIKVPQEGSPPYLRSVSMYAHILALFWTENRSSADDMYSRFLKEINTIPLDNLPKDHVFYPFHREMAELMNITILVVFDLSQGKLSTAIQRLEAAVQLQDSFMYMEPENYYLPLRQCLGAAVFESCKYVEAEKVGECKNRARAIYEEDLNEHPNNAWSTLGLNHVVGSNELSYESISSCCELFKCNFGHS